MIGPLAVLQGPAAPLPSEARQAAWLLGLAPWAWPTESGPALELARAHRVHRPPQAHVLLLATIVHGGGALWAWAPDPTRGGAFPLGPEALSALADAAIALGTALPG